MANLVSVTSEKQAQALKERDRFLKDHPQLLPLQRKIDSRLGHAKSEHNRLVLVHGMMMDSVKALTDSLKLMILSLPEFDQRVKALGVKMKPI
jgi:hypothetical protein